jgi:hypothetical protein
MTCPYCNHTFPLTWARYYKEKWGRHTCPRCSKTGRLKFRPLASIIEIIVGLACALPGGLALQYWLGGLWPLLGLIPMLCVILPLDRRIDEKHREFVAIEGEAPTDTAFCAECQQVFNVHDMIAHNGLHVCARCKPIFLQKLAEGAKLGSGPGRGKT